MEPLQSHGIICRVQPQASGTRWSCWRQNHVAGREWRKVLAICLSRKFPTSCPFHSRPTGQGLATRPHQLKENWELYSLLQEAMSPAKSLGFQEGWVILGQATSHLRHSCHESLLHFPLFFLHQGHCFNAVFANRNGLSCLGCRL